MAAKKSRRPARSRTLTHLTESGEARMVDVSAKPETVREAVARGEVHMRPATLKKILAGDLPKGEVLGAARLAGMQAAKQTPHLIPLCHPVRLTAIDIDFTPVRAKGVLKIEARARAVDATGVEMEALTAVSVAALTVYDMAKAVDRWMTITGVELMEKSGGASGSHTRPAPP